MYSTGAGRPAAAGAANTAASSSSAVTGRRLQPWRQFAFEPHQQAVTTVILHAVYQRAHVSTTRTGSREATAGEIEPRLLAYLRRQHELCLLPAEALVLDVAPAGEPMAVRGPVLADLRAGGGFSITVQVRGAAAPGDVLASAFSTVTAALGEEPTAVTITKGWALTVTADREIELMVTDGFGSELRHATTTASTVVWDGGDHVVSFAVDGGPKVVSVVVDERLDDGGSRVAQGWAFVPATLGEVGGAEVLIHGGTVQRLIVHDRALLTTEAIAAARAMLAHVHE